MPRYIESYVHLNSVGVLVELSCGKETTVANQALHGLARDIAVHISRANPARVDRRRSAGEEIDEFTRRRLERDGLDTGPERILLAQTFTANPKCTVGEAIEQLAKALKDEIRVVRFARFEAGES